MRDQATQLRNLVLRSARQAALELGPAPRLVVLSGGKGGVGVTTLAVNLAVASAQQGSRVVLVDADFHQGDIASHCGLHDTGSVADVLASRRDIHEILQIGPGGIQVASGVWAPNAATVCTEPAQERLIHQLKLLGRHVDLVVLDAGSGTSEAAARFWRAADEIVVVTTPDAIAVMDTYATIKSTLPPHWSSPIQVVVNQVEAPVVAADASRRIHVSCRRFLKRETELLGCVSLDESVLESIQAAVPLLIHNPRSPTAAEFERMAAQLAALDTRATSRTINTAA